MKRSQFLASLLAIPAILSFTGKPERKSTTGKTIFTPEMLKRHNFGLYIIKADVDVFKEGREGYASTVSYKLGWNLGVVVNPQIKQTPRRAINYLKYGMMNFLTDGYYHPIGNTYEEVCNYLNNNPYGVEYRVMTKEEVIYLISQRQQGFL